MKSISVVITVVFLMSNVLYGGMLAVNSGFDEDPRNNGVQAEIVAHDYAFVKESLGGDIQSAEEWQKITQLMNIVGEDLITVFWITTHVFNMGLFKQSKVRIIKFLLRNGATPTQILGFIYDLLKKHRFEFMQELMRMEVGETVRPEHIVTVFANRCDSDPENMLKVFNDFLQEHTISNVRDIRAFLYQRGYIQSDNEELFQINQRIGRLSSGGVVKLAFEGNNPVNLIIEKQETGDFTIVECGSSVGQDVVECQELEVDKDFSEERLEGHLTAIVSMMDEADKQTEEPSAEVIPFDVLTRDEDDPNKTCGTICESGHEGSYNALDEQLKRQFDRLKQKIGITEDRDLTVQEADTALVKYAKDKFGIDITEEQLGRYRKQINDAVEGLGNVQLFFSLPETGTELFWVNGDYAGGHFNSKGTRIHVSLPMVLNHGIDAGIAIALHEVAHIRGEGHNDNDEGMKIVRRLAVSGSRDTLLNSIGESFNDVLDKCRDDIAKNPVLSVIMDYNDPSEWQYYDEEEARIAERFSRMSMEEFNDVYVDLKADWRIEATESSVYEFIDSFSDDLLMFRHHFLRPLSTEKMALDLMNRFDEKPDRQVRVKRLLAKNLAVKCFMRELAYRWRVPTKTELAMRQKEITEGFIETVKAGDQQRRQRKVILAFDSDIGRIDELNMVSMMEQAGDVCGLLGNIDFIVDTGVLLSERIKSKLSALEEQSIAADDIDIVIVSKLKAENFKDISDIPVKLTRVDDSKMYLGNYVPVLELLTFSLKLHLQEEDDILIKELKLLYKDITGNQLVDGMIERIRNGFPIKLPPIEKITSEFYKESLQILRSA